MHFVFHTVLVTHSTLACTCFVAISSALCGPSRLQAALSPLRCAPLTSSFTPSGLALCGAECVLPPQLLVTPRCHYFGVWMDHFQRLCVSFLLPVRPHTPFFLFPLFMSLCRYLAAHSALAVCLLLEYKSEKGRAKCVPAASVQCCTQQKYSAAYKMAASLVTLLNYLSCFCSGKEIHLDTVNITISICWQLWKMGSCFQHQRFLLGLEEMHNKRSSLRDRAVEGPRTTKMVLTVFVFPATTYA